jgi:hypothetical protein
MASGEDVSDEDFKERLEKLNEELTTHCTGDRARANYPAKCRGEKQ